MNDDAVGSSQQDEERSDGAAVETSSLVWREQQANHHHQQLHFDSRRTLQRHGGESFLTMLGDPFFCLSHPGRKAPSSRFPWRSSTIFEIRSFAMDEKMKVSRGARTFDRNLRERSKLSHSF
jgi:hypothetical protein